MNKGKVKHELFDAKNPKHLKAIEKFTDVPREHGHLILQFYDEKPSGYMEVSKEGKAINIEHIHVEPRFRDTIKLSEKEKKIAEKKFGEKLDLVIDKFGGKRSNLPKEELKELKIAEKRKTGRVKAEKQKLLGAKMLRWTAKTYGMPLETAFARSTAGRKHIDRYLGKYDKKFFNRRGAQKPRPRRKK